MNNKILNLMFASSITNLCEVNSSFDSGILRIAYTGANPNGSFISKDAFERCIKTIYNCPIVCNYDRDTDTLGGHDMEVVRDKDGGVKLVNLTMPVGCIPESSNVFWETVIEEDGTPHEYLCAEALLWKRQEAYQKIKKDGIVAHSMEITVKDGESINGLYHIKDFEFTAFALIGVTPCFESSSLEMFSKNCFKEQFSKMMLELKESFSLVNTPNHGDDNIISQNHSMEGGEQVVDKNELIAKYGIDIESLDFSIEDLTVEELEEKFKAMSQASYTQDDDTPPEPPADTNPDNKFALMNNILEEIYRALEGITIQKDWGECQRYWFVDCDMDAHEIYCWDTTDWLLYGFTYTIDGDSVIIDFESKKRKKYIIDDFDEGEQNSPIAQVFEHMEKKVLDNAEWEAKYQDASEKITSMDIELNQLRKFKEDIDNANKQAERDEMFARFKDLEGVEAFESLKENGENIDLETLEEKCFAIRGRQVNKAAKFSAEPKPTKIKIEKDNMPSQVYGGIFEKYGFSEKIN